MARGQQAGCTRPLPISGGRRPGCRRPVVV